MFALFFAQSTNGSDIQQNEPAQVVMNMSELLDKQRELIEAIDRANREAGSIMGTDNLISAKPDTTPEKEISRRKEIINSQFNMMKSNLSSLKSEDSDDKPQVGEAISVEGYIIVEGGELVMWGGEIEKDLAYSIRERFVGNLVVLHTYDPVKGAFEKEKDYELDTLSTEIKVEKLIGKTCAQWSHGSPKTCIHHVSYSIYEIDKNEYYPNFYSGVVSIDSNSGQVTIEASTPQITFFANDGLKRIPAKAGCFGSKWTLNKADFENLMTKGSLLLKQHIGTKSQATPGCRPGSTMTLYMQIKKPEAICKSKEKIIVEIIKPADKSKFVFSDMTVTGNLMLELEAKTTPAKYADYVEWDIPELEGSTMKIIYPQSGSSIPKGSKIMVMYQDLPLYNDAFGKKTITARVNVDNCIAEDKKEIMIFYPRDAKNNPEGKYPNWFYYWKQTPAAKPFGQNVRLNYECEGVPLNKCACIKGGKRTNATGFYNYEVSQYKTINVCNLSKNTDNPQTFQITIPAIKLSLPKTLQERNFFTYTYIDTFAIIVMHEFTHFLNNHNFWTTGYDPIFDRDGDSIPDRVEPELGLDPKKKLSYWQDMLMEIKPTNDVLNPFEVIYYSDDEELLTLSSTYEYQIGTFDKYDWAKPGKNWK
ncbi:hypothetical protein [Thermodesulfovibrio hydrogeniphilus]